MKTSYSKLLLVGLLSIINVYSASSQNGSIISTIKKKVYQLNQSVRLMECNVVGDSLNTNRTKITYDNNNQAINPLVKDCFEDWEFKVDKQVGTNLVLKFLTWNHPEDASLKSNYNVVNVAALDGGGTIEQQRYFLLPIAELDAVAEERFTRYTFAVGTVVLPVKMRFGSKNPVKINPETSKKLLFDFTSDVSLGLTVSGKINFKTTDKFKVQLPLFGFNIGSVAVDSATTSGFLKSKTNLAAITPYTGIIFEYTRFQFGAFVGWDIIAREAGYHWDFRRSPWLGIGLGYAIFSTQGEGKNQ